MFREMKHDREGIFFPDIEILEHPKKGYICLAKKDFEAGELIERCPTVKFDSKLLLDLWSLNDGRMVLHDYNFSMGGGGVCFSYFSMGYGGVYSHADNPNASWIIKASGIPESRDTLLIRAKKPIKKGEEITIKYVKDPRNLWFEQLPPEEQPFEHSDPHDVG